MAKSKILIVDDVELNREMLSQMLGDEYEFMYASNGIEAIELISDNNSIDLILLDLNMPKMDGFGVLKIMKERHFIEEYPVIIISADDSLDYITKAYELGAVDYINRPFRSIVVRNRVSNTLLMYSNQKRLIKLVEKQVFEREKINNSMINIFSNIIELRNRESGSHTLNVQNITNLILHELIKKTNKYKLSLSDVALISTVSALHDIGKIRIPEAILNKPGKLTNEEWEIMKSHSIEGDKILSNSELDQNSKFIKTAREICHYHHEKYDGKGYPEGLVGDEIPISAQVVSLADVYDALTSERCYKKAFTHDEAIKMILNGECGAYNPLLIESLKDIDDYLRQLKDYNEHYSFKDDSTYIIDEILNDDNLPLDNANRRLLDNEKKKKEFFMECAEGIQFEYDKLLHKATFINLREKDESKRKIVFATRESDNNILPIKYWDEIASKLEKTTKDNPIIHMDVMLKVEGTLLPFYATVMALWPEVGDEYISVLGHFTIMH